MALDATARIANVQDSLKRYFVDNFTAYGTVSFDSSLAVPKLQGRETTKWFSIVFDDLDPNKEPCQYVTIFVCTRQDAEGFKLAQMRDNIMGFLVDTDMPDCIKRIPFYKSAPAIGDWELIGGLMTYIESESGILNGPDGSKYRAISLAIKWSAKW